MRLKRWHVMLGIIHFLNFDSHAALEIEINVVLPEENRL